MPATWATCRLGASRSISGRLTAPERMMSSCVMTKIDAAASLSGWSVLDTDDTWMLARSSIDSRSRSLGENEASADSAAAGRIIRSARPRHAAPNARAVVRPSPPDPISLPQRVLRVQPRGEAVQPVKLAGWPVPLPSTPWRITLESLRYGAAMDLQLTGLCGLTFVIHLIGALAYAARIAGVRTRRIAVSFALFNVLVLVSRTSNSFQGPFLAKRIEAALKGGAAVHLLSDFRWLILAATAGAAAGALATPTFQRIFSRAVLHFQAHRSLPKLLLHGFAKGGLAYIRDSVP